MSKNENPFNTTVSFNAKSLISSEAKLRGIIKTYPKMLDKRILTELDTHCLEFIECSKLCVLAVSGKDKGFGVFNVRTSLDIYSNKRLELKSGSDAVSLNVSAETPCFASLYFLAPGVGHALRVNGMVSLLSEEGNAKVTFVFMVEQAYVHCARAAARSQLWSPVELIKQFESQGIRKEYSLHDFLSLTSYSLLKTHSSDWQTEISPRGDQTGFLSLIEDDLLFLPERPGNKVAVSLRNILQNPYVELLCMIPGREVVLHLAGQADVTDDPRLCSMAAVDGKQPKLGILIRVSSYKVVQEHALSESNLWNESEYVLKTQLTPFPKVLSEHMNGTGLLGKATNQVVKAVVNHDMKHLY
ncbi:hypothetical protein [Litoribrevibacter albus]|uniref:Pyridoxamine 5'-phosphate oxidase putative domain-containing protein n=1 Tax=Litoribrevibacter albus TaxID=1473156 RepID=A0AA37W8P0_9GAMM|nr:hypothetical protein [Litoribrevibacter albus]GLQ31751.1 hypothetical protein GCM10007876_22300 [Litoribrevibacter albus]